jgi:nucleoid DNA-binding protein
MYFGALKITKERKTQWGHNLKFTETYKIYITKVVLFVSTVTLSSEV